VLNERSGHAIDSDLFIRSAFLGIGTTSVDVQSTLSVKVSPLRWSCR